MQNVLQQLFAFLMAVVTTGSGNWKYKVPTEKKTETFTIFGRSVTATESYENGEVEFDVKLN